MVNFHALQLACGMLGGFALLPFKLEISLSNCILCTFGGEASTTSGKHLVTGATGKRLQASFGGGTTQCSRHYLDLIRAHQQSAVIDADGYSELEQSWESEQGTNFVQSAVGLGQVLALLELSHHDPDVFRSFSHVLVKGVRQASQAQRQHLVRCFRPVLERNYALSPWDDCHFQVGRLWHLMNGYEEAVKHYRLSQEKHGGHHATLYNLALCHAKLGERAEAMVCLKEALSKRPSYFKARKCLRRLVAEEGAGSPGGFATAKGVATLARALFEGRAGVGRGARARS